VGYDVENRILSDSARGPRYKSAKAPKLSEPLVDNSQEIEMARATDTEKSGQLERLQCFHDEHSEQAAAAQTALKQAVSERQNGFAALMEAVRHCSLGQITDAFFEVGGQYRRSM
jgi:methylmalonyl-CoA mutase